MAKDVALNEVLDALAKAEGSILTADVFPAVSFVKIKAALDSLKSREMIEYKPVEREEAVLTPEAEGIVENGSHEAKVFEAVRQAVDGLKISELPVSIISTESQLFRM